MNIKNEFGGENFPISSNIRKKISKKPDDVDSIWCSDMCLTVVDMREAREMLSEGITDDSGKSIMEFINVNSQKNSKNYFDLCV